MFVAPFFSSLRILLRFSCKEDHQPPTSVVHQSTASKKTLPNLLESLFPDPSAEACVNSIEAVPASEGFLVAMLDQVPTASQSCINTLWTDKAKPAFPVPHPEIVVSAKGSFCACFAARNSTARQKPIVRRSAEQCWWCGPRGALGCVICHVNPFFFQNTQPHGFCTQDTAFVNI